jgi:hypothetical protein
VLSVTFCLSQGNVICPGQDFFGLPFIFIPASKRLPQWFFVSGLGFGRYFFKILYTLQRIHPEFYPVAKKPDAIV